MNRVPETSVRAACFRLRPAFVTLALALAVGMLGLLGTACAAEASERGSGAGNVGIDVFLSGWSATSASALAATDVLTADVVRADDIEVMQPLEGGRIFTDTTIGFTLVCPEDWTQISTDEEVGFFHPDEFLFVSVRLPLEVDAAVVHDLQEGQGELAFKRYLEEDPFSSAYYDVIERGALVMVGDQLARRFALTTRLTEDFPLRIKASSLFFGRGSELYVVEALGSPAAFDRHSDTIDGILGSFRFGEELQPPPVPEPGTLQLSVLTKSGGTPNNTVSASIRDIHGEVQDETSALMPDQAFTLTPGVYDVEISYPMLPGMLPVTARVEVASGQTTSQQIDLPFDEEHLHVVLQREGGQLAPDTVALQVTSPGWDTPFALEGNEHDIWLPAGLTYTLEASYEGLAVEPVRATEEISLKAGEPQSVAIPMPIVEGELRILLRTAEGRILDRPATVQVIALDQEGAEVVLLEELSQTEVVATLLAGTYNVRVQYMGRVERLEGIDLRAEPATQTVTFPSLATLYVLLRREDGRVLDWDADVRIIAFDQETNEENTLAQGTARDEFSVQLLPGTYRVVVTYSGQEIRVDDIQVQSGSEELAVTFPLPGNLVVRLRTSTGLVLDEDATVAIYAAGAEEPITEVVTNDEQIVKLLPGTYGIRATYTLTSVEEWPVEWPGPCPCANWVREYAVGAGSTFQFRTAGSTVGDVDLLLEGWTGSSWVSVASSASSSATESIELTQPEYTRYRIVVINYSGQPGEVRLQVDAVQAIERADQASLAAGETVTRTLEFPDRGALVLRFQTESGSPVRRTTHVTVRQLPLGIVAQQGDIDLEGTFSAPMWAGSYEIAYQYDIQGFRENRLEQPVQVQPGEPTVETITLPFSEGELAVSVRSQTGDELPEDAAIAVFDSIGRQVAEVEASEYSVWLPAGSYQVVVEYAGERHFDEVVQVEADRSSPVAVQVPLE